MATTTDTYDYYYYYNDDLFKLASLMSIHATQEMKDGNGKATVDKFAITENERQMFDRLLKSADADVFRKVKVFSESIANAHWFDVDLSTVVDTLASGDGLMYIMTLPDDFDDNITDIIDVHIEDALVAHVLWKWYKMKGVDKLANDQKAIYEEKIKKILSDRLSRTTLNDRPHRMGIPGT